MKITLCDTFRQLAAWTHDTLTNAESVGHQPLEETFTDLNLLAIKFQHRAEIYTRTFSKWKEGKNGADWEWWITDSTRTRWAGFRVQAKVLDLRSNRFRHLHYTRKGFRQINKLEKSALAAGLIPLYCLYLRLDAYHEPLRPPPLGLKESSLLFGCSLVALPKVRALGRTQDLQSVLPHCAPWHHLVCDASGAARDLPTNAWDFAHRIDAHHVGMTDALRGGFLRSLEDPPPAYVLDVLSSDESDVQFQPEPPDRDLGGILVIAQRPERRLSPWEVDLA
jgi:hypothetical protein